MKIDRLFQGMNMSAQGLSAQRKKMNAISSNIANAETTKTEEGVPYRRKMVTMQSVPGAGFSDAAQSPSIQMISTDPSHLRPMNAGFGSLGGDAASLRSNEEEDQTPFKTVYDPGHPEADEDGYVQMPNVNVVTEMVEMMSATRAYEANIAIINAEKSIAKDSLEI